MRVDHDDCVSWSDACGRRSLVEPRTTPTPLCQTAQTFGDGGRERRPVRPARPSRHSSRAARASHPGRVARAGRRQPGPADLARWPRARRFVGARQELGLDAGAVLHARRAGQARQPAARRSAGHPRTSAFTSAIARPATTTSSRRPCASAAFQRLAAGRRRRPRAQPWTPSTPRSPTSTIPSCATSYANFGAAGTSSGFASTSGCRPSPGAVTGPAVRRRGRPPPRRMRSRCARRWPIPPRPRRPPLPGPGRHRES